MSPHLEAVDWYEEIAAIKEILSFIAKLVPQIEGVKNRRAVAETVSRIITMSPKKYGSWRRGSKLSVQVLELLGRIIYGKIGDFKPNLNKDCLLLLEKLLLHYKKKSKKKLFLL